MSEISNFLSEAREKGEKIISMTVEAGKVKPAIRFCLNNIRSGEQIQIQLPRELTNLNSNYNYSAIDELQQEFCGPWEDSDCEDNDARDDIFPVLRFPKRDDDMIMMDIYRL